MVLGESYKESNGSQEAAVNRAVLLRCRHQLGQLRENDETIVHALNQVLPGRLRPSCVRNTLRLALHASETIFLQLRADRTSRQMLCDAAW